MAATSAVPTWDDNSGVGTEWRSSSGGGTSGSGAEGRSRGGGGVGGGGSGRGGGDTMYLKNVVMKLLQTTGGKSYTLNPRP